MSHYAASQIAERHPHLNRVQQRSVEQVLTSPDRIQAIQGYAGVGKSTALAAVRDGAESAGYAVEGFAPTSRAAQQLRDAGISATTLQSFLARDRQEQFAGDPARRHLYLLDESSLASTKQVRDFLQKINPQDMVLLVGDIRQHQAVEAGKPFEQLQQAGMRTAQLDQIVRQKDAELLKVVEHLSKGDVPTGVRMLQEQGRVTEIRDRAERIRAIAKEYATNPEKTLIVSPDNTSRREINEAVHIELQQRGRIASQDHPVRVLVQRADMTGADRAWASRYEVGDVLHYQRGSASIGIQGGSYAQVVATDPKENNIIHSQGWSRDQVVSFMRQYGVDEPLIQSETDRYIAVPGQALSYKLGQLKILELRDRAQKELGPKFDIRTFDDEMLNGGVLPLDMLDARTDSWIHAQLAPHTTSTN